MKRGTPSHPKVDDLMDSLGVSRVVAVGTLELMWHFTAKYAIQGDVGKWSDARIASACEWDGPPETLILGLGLAGWLDRSDEHRLLVHDWPVHADQAVKKTLSNRGLAFLDGGVPFAFQKESSQWGGRVPPTPGSGSGTGKAQAQERQGGKKKTAEQKRKTLSEAIARVYRAKVGRPGDDTVTPSGRGPKNIAKLLKVHSAKVLRAAAVNYAESCEILGTEAEFRKACGNFFGRDATFLAFLPGEYKKPVVESAVEAQSKKNRAAMQRAAEGLQ